MTRLLVDGNGLSCGLWWGMPGGVADRFLNIVRGVRADAEILVCWDAEGSWRKELYPAYKSHRGPKPEGLLQALNDCQKLPLAGCRAPGFEADDLIATYVRYFEGMKLVLSNDKDMLQLVGDDVLVVRSCRRVVDAAAVKAKFGVPPELLRHLFSWTGDASDNLPGVRGYGPKRAVARALAGEIGDAMTYELAGLATVPWNCIERWAADI